MPSQQQLQDLFEFLRFPSISANPTHALDVRACAEWLRARLGKAGFTAQIRETEGHPVVTAKNEFKPGLRTLLIYGHYDVQPVDPLPLWKRPPFEPYEDGGRIYARGSADNKGQIFAHVLGAEEALKRDELPVNLIFLIEGEEEVGSVHLAPFIQKHREEFACDVIAISDTCMVAPATPTFSYGLRGIAAMEIDLYGPAQDLHSGLFGGAVVNPLTALSRMLAALHDPDGRVAIPGFYDKVQPIKEWERRQWQLLDPDQTHLLKASGAPSLGGEAGYTPLERIWVRPTAEINGLWGGYQGPGSKTVLPSEAHAKLTFRLVPDQDPADILQRAEAFFRRLTPAQTRIEITHGHGGRAYLVDPTAGFGLAAQKALSQAFGGKNPVLVREGGSIPIVSDLKDILGADTLLLGLAMTDSGIHSPNENFPVENFDFGIQMHQALLKKIADR